MGGIAHEINNPLAIISGKLGLLEMVLESQEIDKDAFKENIREVMQTTDRISEIIHNLKTFSRDPDKDDFQEYSLAKIIEEILSLCAEKLRLSNIDIECRIDPEINLFVRRCRFLR